MLFNAIKRNADSLIQAVDQALVLIDSKWLAMSRRCFDYATYNLYINILVKKRIADWNEVPKKRS
jgi:hypothetical protein